MGRLKSFLVSTLLLMTIFSTTFFFSGSVSAASSLAGTSSMTGGKPSNHPDIKAEGAWFQLSHFGKTLPAPDARMKAMQQASKVRRLSPNGSAPVTWTPLGPQPINASCNTCLTFGVASGRITALAVNPTNSSELWAGAADGGVWHSTDGGAHWASVSDSWPTLSIGAITIDPNNANTVYVGTGEGNLNGDAYWGAGIFKTTDDGAHWTQLGFAPFGGMGITKIAVDPHNSSIVLASATFDGATTPPGGAPSDFSNGGIWRSTDGGSIWNLVKSNPTVLADFGTDVLFDPAHAGVAFAGLANVFGFPTSVYTSIAGVYKSTDDGATWSPLSTGIPTGNSIERISLGISHDGQHLYAVLTDAGLSAGTAFGNLLNSSIYVSTNNGVNWTAHAVPAEMVNDHSESQWWYDTYAAVDPTVSTGNTAYVGGVDIWQTTNGGTNWTNLSNAYAGGPTHPDQHALAFLSTTSSTFYVGNDGGVWKVTSGGAFTNLNSGGLDITQFYGGSIGEVGTHAQLYGGAQDNGEDQFPVGSPLTGPVAWNMAFGGDGGDTAVDYTNNSIIYEEFFDGNINKSIDGGATWNPAAPPLTGNVNFIMPFVMSPNTHTMLVAGRDQVYLTINGGSSWTAISPVLDPVTGGGGAPISALAVAPGNDKVIYAGDDNGNIYVTTNGGTSWSSGVGPGPIGAIVTGLAVDPTNPAVVYATFSTFAPASGQHVFKSTNSGTNWSDISISLPNVPFEAVLVSPNDHNLVIAGSDAGVFGSPDGGATWGQVGSGLPNAAINQLFSNHTGTELFVATHGRGMWEFPLATPPYIQANPSAVALATTPGSSPSPQTVTLSNPSAGPLSWSAGSLPSWVSVSPTSGTIASGSSEPLTLTFNTPSTTPQTYTTNLVLTNPNASSMTVSVPITVVAAQVSKTWYFAEGFTGGSFTEFLTLENPNSSTNSTTVEYFLGSGSPITKTYALAANSRTTLVVNQEVGANQNVSMVVTGTLPLVAERPMYFTYTGLAGFTIPGGTDVLGATTLGEQFDFGYIDTTNTTTVGHDPYLTFLNPNNATMNVTIDYFPAAGGSPIVTQHAFAANSRGTINIRTQEGLPQGTYSALVSLDQPGLVERPLYLKDAVTGFTGSADVIGVATPQTDWYFAEGFTNTNFSERYYLSNPNLSGAASATVTFFLSNGSTQSTTVSIPAGGQVVVDANSLLGNNVNNSAHVSASLPILAERFMSFDYPGATAIPGATDVLGTTAPSTLFYFAEGYTGTGFAEFLTIENPSTTQAASVTVTFYPEQGGTPTVQVYTIGPDTRFTLYTNTLMPNQPFSMVVGANVPIVAERPMYFNYLNSGQTGGSDIVGYQP